ncbi:MAG TPA: methyltransferase domain-containing protein [Candidatus Polarisedimenticolia bacterium]|nr:methyltransferase domain-containing protein [Candidatus Polarisedimenticolia bacterium]
MRPPLLPDPLRRAMGSLRDEIRIALRAAGGKRRLRALGSRSDLRLHLGCGGELKPGWVNVDLDGRGLRKALRRAPAGTIFVPYDLRRGSVPLPDGCCAVVYSSHFLEHLDYEPGVRLMRDCHRLLAPGGIFRAALPTFRAMFRAYLDGDAAYFDEVPLASVRPDVEPGTETLVDHLNYGLYQYGEHRCVYDEEKLCRILERIGFRQARPSEFRPDLDPDNPLRRRYSFYVEAVK